MGDMADAILNGEMCECGSYLEGPAEGYPCYCSEECREDYNGAECDNIRAPIA